MVTTQDGWKQVWAPIQGQGRQLFEIVSSSFQPGLLRALPTPAMFRGRDVDEPIRRSDPSAVEKLEDETSDPVEIRFLSAGGIVVEAKHFPARVEQLQLRIGNKLLKRRSRAEVWI